MNMIEIIEEFEFCINFFCEHCPYVAGKCFSLSKSLGNLESIVKSQVSETDKKIKLLSKKATIFLQTIGHGPLRTNILMNLVEYWDELDSFFVDFEKMKRSDGIIRKSIDWMKGNTINSKGAEKAIAELNVLRERIGYIIYEYVRNAAHKLISVDPNITDALNLMTNSQEEVVFWLSFHFLRSQKGSLYEWVLTNKQSKFNEEGNLDNLIDKAHQSLACVLKLLTHEASISLSNAILDMLNELLRFLQDHDAILSNMKEIVERDDFVCCNEVIETIKINILKCDHKTCCASLVKPLSDLKTKSLKFSFLYEKRLDSLNDYE